MGSVAVARLAEKPGSSCSVYGAVEDGGERCEQSTLNPQSAYGRCKVLVERDAGALADTISHACSCGTIAFGASPRMWFGIGRPFESSGGKGYRKDFSNYARLNGA